MKLKDIEKNLKAEQEGKKVPDVLARAKKAPLNKLLDGETPGRAFQKDVAIQALVLVTVLLLVVIMVIMVMVFKTSSNQNNDLCYVSISVERGGEQTRIGVILRGYDDVQFVAIECEGGEEILSPSATYSSDIAGFVTLEDGDSIKVCALCKDANVADSATKYVADILEYANPSFIDNVSRSSNGTETLNTLKTYMEHNGAEMSAEDGIQQTLQKYFNMFV